MKELYINADTNILVDTENKTAGKLQGYGYVIKRLIAIEEPMHIIYNCGERDAQFDAEAGDVLAILYHKDFDKDVIILKDKELYDSLLIRKEKDEEEKLAWAENNCNDCCKGC